MPIRSLCASPAMTRRSIAACSRSRSDARAAFDALEQARVESIGSRRMDGVAANIGAMLDDRYQRAPLRRDRRAATTRRSRTRWRCIVRERLTGLAPPPNARKARRSLAALRSRSAPAPISTSSSARSRISAASRSSRIDCSRRSSSRARAPAARRIAEEPSEDEPQNPDEAEGEETEEETQSGSSEMETAMASEDALREGRERSRRSARQRDAGGDRIRRRRRGDGDAPPARSPPADRSGGEYRAYTTRFDEIVKAEELCDAEELDRLRAYLDKQLCISPRSSAASPIACSAV